MKKIYQFSCLLFSVVFCEHWVRLANNPLSQMVCWERLSVGQTILNLYLGQRSEKGGLKGQGGRIGEGGNELDSY